MLKTLLVKLMREVADKIDAGTCEMTEDEAMEVMRVLCHEPLSKEQACDYLHVRRSRFDELMRLGQIPRGRKKKGHKELVWYKDELQINK